MVSRSRVLLAEVNLVAVLFPAPSIAGTDEPMDKIALVIPLLTFAFPPKPTCFMSLFPKVVLLEIKMHQY